MIAMDFQRLAFQVGLNLPDHRLQFVPNSFSGTPAQQNFVLNRLDLFGCEIE
jgi:hypothetical protein